MATRKLPEIIVFTVPKGMDTPGGFIEWIQDLARDSGGPESFGSRCADSARLVDLEAMKPQRRLQDRGFEQSEITGYIDALQDIAGRVKP